MTLNRYFYQCNGKQSEFGTNVSFYYMNMDWFMVIGIKHETKTKQNKYCRHILCYISLLLYKYR